MRIGVALTRTDVVLDAEFTIGKALKNRQVDEKGLED
jgi:hypothetical protein